MTEMRVITLQGGIYQLTPDELAELDTILKEDVKPRETTSDAVSKITYGGKQENGKNKGARGG